MRRILVLAPPEGQCDWAVSLAGELAAREGLEVLLVRVLEERVLSQPRGTSGPDAERLRSLLVDAEVRVLEGIAAPLRAASHAGAQGSLAPSSTSPRVGTLRPPTC